MSILTLAISDELTLSHRAQFLLTVCLLYSVPLLTGHYSWLLICQIVLWVAQSYTASVEYNTVYNYLFYLKYTL